MVWGLDLDGGFGEFAPEGDFVGYDAALKAYYASDMLAEEKAAMGMEEVFLVSPFSAKFKANMGPLRAHECPQEFRCRAGQKSLGSLIELNSGLVAVDQDLKDIIEKLERGVHQFWPIRITMPKGKEYPAQYFGMVIGSFLDGFVPEKSDAGSWSVGGAVYQIAIPNKKYFNGLAVSHSAVGAAHLWRDTALRRPALFLSDTLQQAIKDAGLRIPKHYKLKAAEEVSEAPQKKTLATVGTAEWLRFQAALPKKASPRKESDDDLVWAFFQNYMLFSFTPAGHYPGFKDVLDRYYDEEMSEFEKARLDLRDGLRYANFGRKFIEDLGPLKPQECPAAFQTHDNYETFPSFLALNARLPKSDLESWAEHGRVLAVDERLKAIIEALEPGVHQFWPIRFMMSAGKAEYPTQIYGLVIRQFLDSFDATGSKAGSYREGNGNFYAIKASQKAVSGLALSRAAIESAHLWREKRLHSPAVFLSGALMGAIQEAGLIVPEFFKLKMV